MIVTECGICCSLGESGIHICEILSTVLSPYLWSHNRSILIVALQGAELILIIFMSDNFTVFYIFITVFEVK